MVERIQHQRPSSNASWHDPIMISAESATIMAALLTKLSQRAFDKECADFSNALTHSQRDLHHIASDIQKLRSQQFEALEAGAIALEKSVQTPSTLERDKRLIYLADYFSGALTQEENQSLQKCVATANDAAQFQQNLALLLIVLVAKQLLEKKGTPPAKIEAPVNPEPKQEPAPEVKKEADVEQTPLFSSSLVSYTPIQLYPTPLKLIPTRRFKKMDNDLLQTPSSMKGLKSSVLPRMEAKQVSTELTPDKNRAFITRLFEIIRAVFGKLLSPNLSMAHQVKRVQPIPK